MPCIRDGCSALRKQRQKKGKEATIAKRSEESFSFSFCFWFWLSVHQIEQLCKKKKKKKKKPKQTCVTISSSQKLVSRPEAFTPTNGHNPGSERRSRALSFLKKKKALPLFAHLTEANLLIRTQNILKIGEL